MKKLIILLTALFVLVSIVACGGGNGTKPSTMQKVFKPDWYDQQDESGTYVFTYGTAEKMSENMSVSAAKNRALLDAAMYVETYVKGMMKDFEQEAGYDNPQVLALTEQVAKSVAKAKFNGVQYPKVETYQNSETGKYKTYVRAAIPTSQVKKEAHDFIRSEEAAYNEFKATQSFKALEEEVQNY